MDAKELVKSVGGSMHGQALELAENVLFMAAKLDEARDLADDAALVIEYDNGGGQKGTRKNPLFDAYHSMLASYCKALSMLCDVLEKHGAASEDTETALDDLRSKVIKLRPAQ